MQISSLTSNWTLQGLQSSSVQSTEESFEARIKAMREKEQKAKQNSGTDTFESSTAGQVMQQIMSLSQSGDTKAQGFAQELFQSLQSGSIDAAKLAEDAPDSLKSYAETNGIDLKDVFNQISSDFTQMQSQRGAHGMNGSMPPPPPPPSDSTEESSSTDTDSTTAASIKAIMDELKNQSTQGNTSAQSFAKELFDSLKSGNADAAKLAEDAPDELKQFAEENGIDLTAVFTDMKNHPAPPNGGTPPPPPPDDSTSNSVGGTGSDSVRQILDQLKSQSSQGNTAAQSFAKELFDSLKSGNFDAEQLAKDAPEELKSYAEKNGIDLKQVFTDFKTKDTEMKNKIAANNSNFINPSGTGASGSSNTDSSNFFLSSVSNYLQTSNFSLSPNISLMNELFGSDSSLAAA